MDYTRESFRVSWDARFIDEVNEEFEDQGTGEIFKRTVSDRLYHDFQMAYDFDSFGLTNTLLVGVDNAFDKDPPLSLDGFNDNTDVRTFDTLGRFLYVRLTTGF